MREKLEKYGRWLMVGLVLLFFARLVDASQRQSVTFDEPIHVFQGIMYWQHQPLYSVVRNPPLLHAIVGLPVSQLFHPTLPPNVDEYALQDWLRVSQQTLWETNNNGLVLIFVGRFMIISLALLLAAVLYRWGRQITGQKTAALLAVVLFTIDPNVLAHSFLATTDLGMAFFLFLAAYGAWRYWQRGGWLLYGLAGVAMGAAWGSKFSAVILLPALIIVSLWRGVQERKIRPFVESFGWLLIAAFVLCAIYRFQLDTLRLDFQLQQEHLATGHSAFLWGQLSKTGWWYYFPVIFAIKTPIITLILLVVGTVQFLQRRGWSWQWVWVLVLAAGVAGGVLTSRVNLGYRYLLPALPLLYLFLSSSLLPSLPSPLTPRSSLLLPFSLLLLAAESLYYHPHYLAYFNQLVGGPANGWRYAVDSNLDWGQDWAAVQEYMAQNGIETVNANWLGTAPLMVYGINGRSISGWPMAKEDPLTDWFYPERPFPGTYILSATQLWGVYLNNPQRFAWFRERPPDDRIGYSLFVYHVPADGAAVGAAFSGIGPAMVAADDYTQAFASNQVRPVWFDARTSFVWPQGEHSWLAVGEGHLPSHPALQGLYPSVWQGGQQVMEGVAWQYRLFELPSNLAETAEFVPMAETAVFGGALQFLGYRLAAQSPTVELLTFWHVQGQPATELKIFVHLVNERGELVAQHDGLDVVSSGLQAGDEMAQLHSLPSLPPGNYTAYIGVYDPGTFGRLTTVWEGKTADSIPFFTLTLP